MKVRFEGDRSNGPAVLPVIVGAPGATTVPARSTDGASVTDS